MTWASKLEPIQPLHLPKDCLEIHLISAGKASDVVYAHCAVLQRAVHWELANTFLYAALCDFPRPYEVSHLRRTSLIECIASLQICTLPRKAGEHTMLASASLQHKPQPVTPCARE